MTEAKDEVKKDPKPAARKREAALGTCIVCAQPLGIPGGYGETDMCGPCATGEAATLEERGETW